MRDDSFQSTLLNALEQKGFADVIDLFKTENGSVNSFLRSFQNSISGFAQILDSQELQTLTYSTLAILTRNEIEQDICSIQDKKSLSYFQNGQEAQKRLDALGFILQETRKGSDKNPWLQALQQEFQTSNLWGEAIPAIESALALHDAVLCQSNQKLHHIHSKWNQHRKVRNGGFLARHLAQFRLRYVY